MYSKHIKEFADAIRQAQADYTYYHERVGIKDKETQDLLHQIELEKPSERNKTATKLANVRKERREAKDMVENTADIVEFLSQNKSFLNQLGQLLGKVKKAEKSHEGRSYRARIRDDLTI